LKLLIFIASHSRKDNQKNIDKEKPLTDYKTAFCSLLTLMVLEKKIFKDLAIFGSFSFSVLKLFQILEPYEQTLRGSPKVLS
jgi:hypothetical protein